METNIDQRIDLAISRAVDKINEDLPNAEHLKKSPATILFGKGGRLDSLGLVSFIVEVEERVAEEFGISIVLADERAMSQQNSPFLTIQTLSDYVALLLREDDNKAHQ